MTAQPLVVKVAASKLWLTTTMAWPDSPATVALPCSEKKYEPLIGCSHTQGSCTQREGSSLHCHSGNGRPSSSTTCAASASGQPLLSSATPLPLASAKERTSCAMFV